MGSAFVLPAFLLRGRMIIWSVKPGMIGFAVCLHCKLSHDISAFLVCFGFWVIFPLMESNYLTCLLDHFLILDYFYMQAVPIKGMCISEIIWFLLVIEGAKSKITQTLSGVIGFFALSTANPSKSHVQILITSLISNYYNT